MSVDAPLAGLRAHERGVLPIEAGKPLFLLSAASRPVKASAFGEGGSRLPLRGSPGMLLEEVTGFPFSAPGFAPRDTNVGTTYRRDNPAVN
jgi:hypothetical protein